MVESLFLCFRLFYVFFWIGLFAFGGGYVIVPMIAQEIRPFGIMSEQELSNMVALSQMTPGPIAVNAATYVGYHASGFWGSVFATFGVTLPSFIIVLLVIAFLNKFKTSPIIKAILSGIRPATVGLLATSVILFAENSVINGKLSDIFNAGLNFINIPNAIIFTLTLIASVKYKVGPIALTVLAGVLGAFML